MWYLKSYSGGEHVVHLKSYSGGEHVVHLKSYSGGEHVVPLVISRYVLADTVCLYTYTYKVHTVHVFVEMLYIYSVPVQGR